MALRIHDVHKHFDLCGARLTFLIRPAIWISGYLGIFESPGAILNVQLLRFKPLPS
jgi:hypothetical protein